MTDTNCMFTFTCYTTPYTSKVVPYTLQHTLPHLYLTQHHIIYNRHFYTYYLHKPEQYSNLKVVADKSFKVIV